MPSPADTFPCPNCKRPVTVGEKSFPFCCERCRLVDLGAWLEERYTVSRPLYPQVEGDALEGGEAAEDVSSEETHEE